MTDEKFSELVNLYLDQEISAVDFELLKVELAKSPQRKAEFQGRCRLHQAMRLAMGGTISAAQDGPLSGASARRVQGPAEVAASGHASQVHVSRWLIGTGLAACLALGGLLVVPVLTSTTEVANRSLDGFVEEDLIGHDPLETVGRSDLKRFATTQQRPGRRSASLAAELRLLGLRPEMMASERPLSEVSMASFQPRDVSQRQVEMFNELKDYSPMPEAEILQTTEPRATRSVAWPAGFQSSLASFK